MVTTFLSNKYNCKSMRMKKIRSKIRVIATLYIDFSDVQGQITPESVVGSGRNTKSSKL